MRELINRIFELFDYIPERGELVWRKPTTPRVKIGDVAGHLRADGYRRVSVDGKDYLIHRLIWLIEVGDWPQHELDHLNGRRDDNRFRNLRDVPRRTNIQNFRRARIDNATGFLGVRKRRSRYHSVIVVHGRTVFLGSFDTPELAYEAYLKAKRQWHVGCTI